MVQPAAAAPKQVQFLPMPDDVKDLKHKLLIYGKSGVGKTRFASDLARFFRVAWLTSEQKMTSILSNPHYPEIKKNMKRFMIGSWEDARAVVNYLFDHPTDFDWVVTDSISDVNKRIREEIASDPKKDEMLTKLDWNKISTRMEKFIRAIRDLPMNTLCIALSTEVRNEMTGQVTQYPSLTGGMKEEVPGYMETIGYAYTSENQTAKGIFDRYITFRLSPNAIAKDEFDVLDVERLDMEAILKKTKLIT